MPESFRLEFPSEELAVRRALERLRHWLLAAGWDGAVPGKVELVLGEVLNNVVEHAYDGKMDGLIVLSCRARGAGLAFDVKDAGREMPGLALPKRRPAKLDCALDDLPEGGFGWFMVHELTEDLAYHRVAGRNALTFSVIPDDQR
ncbi:ATP-binding protein [Marimonas lutisalis]|uniref:ATP-binding protein n=1 Tax=Marimonas lutisalis TaxID=2545756 RepID=UPI0013762B93|nr:ATP-binding protein [Marimonas lutisalis]